MMKKLINLLKDFLKKGQPVLEKNNPAYFEEKLKSMKVELLSEKIGCGCGRTCQCANGTKKLEAAKAELKKPVHPKPKTPKLDQVKADAERMQKKPVAKKPAAKPATAKKPTPKKPKPKA